MNLSAVKNYLQSLSLPAFRQRQITKNYFSGRFLNFSSMTDIPLSLRADLDLKFSLLSVKEENVLASTDSKKALLSLSDGQKIETVLLDYHDWLSVCASTQVGCLLGCKFCATGKMGFIRNLTEEEIIDQIIYWNHKLYPKYVGRIAFMGMGEPFLNWDNLIVALNLIRSKNGLNLGSRKISISTAGIVPRIYDFADLNTEINLAISLHSAIQSTRESLMPIAQKYPLSDLTKSLYYYTQKTHRQLFLEYAPIADINDTQKEIDALIKLLFSDKLFFLNLIPLNPVKGGLIPSSKINKIEKQLKESGVDYSLRHSLGQSINSACGQLATAS
ncbi:MAG: 23S rRNA (adenine(2503)-C(2))-methyltransferase RlmN [Patescibacteria group bacterium]